MNFTEQSLKARLAGKSIFFATPCYGAALFLNYHISLLKTTHLLRDLGVGWEHPASGGDSLVQRARNVLVGEFLKSDCTHIMFIDADIGWNAVDVVKLLAGGKDVVGGVYPKKCYPLEWPANPFFNQEPVVDPDTGWVEWKDLPTGFLLIQRGVFLDLIAKHPEWKTIFDPAHDSEPFSYSFFDCFHDNGIYLSEDFAFCRRVQAEGYQTWCDPTVSLSHYGGHLFRGGCIADAMFSQAEEKIEGWMSKDELRWLKAAAHDMGSIIEIGAWKGRSTHALLAKCSGPVYAVDTWRGSPEDIETHHAEAKEYSILPQFLENVGHFANLNVCESDSQNPELLDRLPEVDMVFIDGSHEYEAVLADIQSYQGKARKLICGHDFDRPGVQRAVSQVFGKRASIAAGSIWQVWI